MDSASPVSLNDLPSVHPGALVLERCFTRITAARNNEVVKKEYTQDKYAEALALVRGNKSLTPFDVRMAEFRCNPATDWCFSEGEQLFKAPLTAVQRRFDRRMVQILTEAARDCRTVVELGCGYGYNLHRLSQDMAKVNFVGGDLAQTAIALAAELYGTDARIKVEEFDYYGSHYDILDRVESPVLVYTCHSIEQLPSAKKLLAGLSAQRNKIARVIHLEPVFECHSDSLVGRLRRAHANSVDYNRDLLSLLRADDSISVDTVDPNFFGINPLNPTTLIQWHFR